MSEFKIKPIDSGEEVKEFYNKYFTEKISVSSNKIDAVVGFFEKRGFLTASFLFFYGIFRFFIEYFREPDGHIGLIYFNLSMGQILSLPMIVSGLYFMTIFYNKKMDN